MLRLYFVIAFSIILWGCREVSKDPETVSVVVTPASFAEHKLIDLDASSDMKEILCQHWENKEDAAVAKENPGSQLDLVYRGYHVFQDSIIVKDPRSGYLTGRWTLDESRKPLGIKAKYSNGKVEHLNIAMLTPFTLKLQHANEEGKPIIEYSGEAISHQIPTEDPFHPMNNKWRIKPSKKETKAQLKARLKQVIHFYILFYDHAIHSNAANISFAGLPTCFTWYAGGIYLVKTSELSNSWISCFYNTSQAAEVNEIASALLDKQYEWPKGETNWVKQNVYVLRQMEKAIDSL